MIKILPYPLFLLLLLISHCTFAQSLPVVVELESGQVGSAFETKLENAVTFVSVTGNGTGDLPTSAERVIKLTVTFQEAGEYDLYLRCRVGPNAANDDSFFYGNGFGEKSLSNAEEWIRANGLSGVGYSNLNELVDGGGGAGQNIWKWINLSEFTGDEAPVKFTVDAGNLTRTFVIGAREDGFDMDKIAFANASLFYSVKNLDNKEPGRTTSGPDFRPIAEGKGKFLGNVYSSSQIRWFENYWNQVTPENAGKWGTDSKAKGIDARNSILLRSNLVSDIMTSEPLTIGEEERIGKAVEIFLENNFKCLPVVNDNNMLCGIITTYDLLVLAYTDFNTTLID